MHEYPVRKSDGLGEKILFSLIYLYIALQIIRLNILLQTRRRETDR